MAIGVQSRPVATGVERREIMKTHWYFRADFRRRLFEITRFFENATALLAAVSWVVWVAQVVLLLSIHGDIRSGFNAPPICVTFFIGVVLGAPLWGRFADGRGRNRLFRYALGTTGVGACLAALSFSGWIISLEYLILGFGLSGVFLSSLLLTAESVASHVEKQGEATPNSVLTRQIIVIASGMLGVFLVSLVTLVAWGVSYLLPISFWRVSLLLLAGLWVPIIYWCYNYVDEVTLWKLKVRDCEPPPINRNDKIGDVKSHLRFYFDFIKIPEHRHPLFKVLLCFAIGFGGTYLPLWLGSLSLQKAGHSWFLTTMTRRGEQHRDAAWVAALLRYPDLLEQLKSPNVVGRVSGQFLPLNIPEITASENELKRQYSMLPLYLLRAIVALHRDDKPVADRTVIEHSLYFAIAEIDHQDDAKIWTSPQIERWELFAKNYLHDAFLMLDRETNFFGDANDSGEYTSRSELWTKRKEWFTKRGQEIQDRVKTRNRSMAVLVWQQTFVYLLGFLAGTACSVYCLRRVSVERFFTMFAGLFLAFLAMSFFVPITVCFFLFGFLGGPLASLSFAFAPSFFPVHYRGVATGLALSCVALIGTIL